ncbi:PLP-dependent aminotransferase family protein [Hoeflea sp. WL0058]|uniref:PLP-dependent aminotransferase family protein n=1 Tax=Flavimaribacter sediminis TaxID=2865987 RepID=A0AAE3CZL2_9HYPH|nr:PLP-dependent aminotransferase family protein [Flavimaribacter sediminis]MBW8637445.1 PLP-dependent aminotransferase family protein [Flavimaribacter sediminis]
MPEYRFADRAEALRQSSRKAESGIIVVNKGKIFPPLLPDISEECQIASKLSAETLQTGPAMGLTELRDSIVEFVAADGVACARNEVLVTNGAKQAIELACRVFLNPGDRVIVSAPTFATGLQIIQSHGAKFLVIPQDDDGMDVAFLEKELASLEARGEPLPKLLFEIVDLNNPTGSTMPEARRRHLIDLAKHYGFVILEDSAYRRMHFEEAPVKALKGFDDSGVVVMLGTFSKNLAPGMRLGWAVGAPDIVQRMAMLKADGGSSPFTQRLVVEMIRRGRMDEQIELVRSAMRDRCALAIAAVRRELPDVQFRTPEGSFYLWIRLPEGLSARDLTARAREEGVGVASGWDWFPNHESDSFLRFAYSGVSESDLEEGIRRLGVAYQSVTAEIADSSR